METLEKYKRLKAKYKKLQEDYADIWNRLESDGKHIMDLESEILDINTRTIQGITNNNKRFNNN